MTKSLFKYGLVLFLFNTVFLSIESTFVLGSYIFYALMVLYSLVILMNPKQIKQVIFHRAFSFLLTLNIVNLAYFLLFHSLSDFEAVKYILARGMQFSIISFSVYYNFEYYKNKFFEHLVYIIFGIILISLVAYPDIFSERYSGIMWNPNALASFSVIGFSALLLHDKKKTNFDYSLLFIFLIVSLSTGSRGVLIGISLAFVFKYGFSIRNIIYVSFAISTYLAILTVQLDTSVNRFADQSLFNDRLLQYKYAVSTLLEKPLFGFGLDKYAFINPKIIPRSLTGNIISAHNGYLALLVQYGLVFGFLILGIIFRKSFSFFNKTTFIKPENRFYIYLVSYTFIAAVYETLITGINEFHTILFWFALAFLSYSKFKEANAI